MLLATFAMTAVLAAAPSANNESTRRVVEHQNALLHSPTNDEINAAESGSPDSPEYRNRPAFKITGDVNAEWEALEAGNPDAVRSVNRSKDY